MIWMVVILMVVVLLFAFSYKRDVNLAGVQLQAPPKPVAKPVVPALTSVEPAPAPAPVPLDFNDMFKPRSGPTANP